MGDTDVVAAGHCWAEAEPDLLLRCRMRLDLIVPSYRRPQLLQKTLESVVRVERPAGISLRVIVVDNDGGVSDQASIRALVSAAPFPIVLLVERKPGKSNALNAAIRMADADYLGFIDDDEELEPSWFKVVQRALETGAYDYIGGRAVPVWHGGLPDWVPREYPAVVGIAENGPVPLDYGYDFPGVLSGGNAVISRRIFDRVGLFTPWLGPRRGRRLLSSEDEDMYWRLVDSGARGRYLPDLIVYHHVHPDRLTKRYFRRWCFWNGASKAVLSRHRVPRVPLLAGVPRYLYRQALQGMVQAVAKTLFRRPAHRRLAAELAVWGFAGYFYGRHFYRGGGRLSDRAAHAGAGPAGDLPVTVP